MDMKVLPLVVLLCLVQPLRTRHAVREVQGYLPESTSVESTDAVQPKSPHKQQHRTHQEQQQQQQREQQQQQQQREQQQQLQQLQQQSKQKTTFVIPRGNNIQIALGGASDDPQTGLHVDLLRLYKEVMEEILQRNKLIATVQTMLEKVALVDELVQRVERLEMISTNSFTDGHGERKGKHKTKGKGGKHGGKGHGPDGSREFNNSVSHEQVVGTDGELGDWEMLVMEVQKQGKALWSLREERKSDHRLTADLMSMIQHQREQITRLTNQVNKQEEDINSCREKSLEQAQVIEDHTSLLDLHQTELDVVSAKVTKISLDVQWQSFKINMQENNTESMKKDITDLQAFLGTSSAVRGTDMFTMWNRAKADIERCQSDISTIHKKIRDIEDDTQTLLQHMHKDKAANYTSHQVAAAREHRFNETYILSMQQFVEETASRLYNLIHRLNATQRQLTQRTTDQQKQMDDMSLDVERLKDELGTYSRRLTDVARNVEHLKDYNLHGRREREKLRRKLEKLQREVRQLLQNFGDGLEPEQPFPYPGPGGEGGHTWLPASSAPQYRSTGSPSWARRTTATRKASSHVTPTTRDTSIPGTPRVQQVTLPPRHRDTPPPATPLKVTSLPLTTLIVQGEPVNPVDMVEGGEEPPHPSDNQVLRPTQDLGTSAPTKPPAIGNCSVSGFGGRRLLRTFRRILTGAWMKDPTRDEPNVYVLRNNVKVTNVREYANEEDLQNNTVLEIHHLPFRCTGTGHVVYRQNLYCNRYKSNRIIRFNLRNKQVASAKLRNAGYNNTFPYSSGALTDIDLSVDELGLWAIYSSATHQGHIVIGLLNPESLAIERMWVTRHPKAAASNTFMVCGRLYTTSYTDNQPVQISYIYDTNTGQEIPVHDGDIVFHTDVPDFQTSLDYNPKDNKLYAWNLSKDWDGQLVKYDVYFNPDPQ